MNDDDDLHLEPFDPEFVARKEGEFLAQLMGLDDDEAPDLLQLHPFEGDRNG